MVKALPPGRTVAGHYPGGRNTLNKEVSRMNIHFWYIKVTFWILDFGCLFSALSLTEVIPMEYETVNMVLARYRELLELNEAKIEESADML
jgi:hypothetical protein